MIAALVLQHASVERHENSVTIKIPPFEGGAAVYDALMDAYQTVLGQERFSYFTALGGTQLDNGLHRFGAESRTIALSEEPAANSNATRYVIRDVRRTVDGTSSQTIDLNTFEDVAARYGLVSSLFKKK